MRLMNSITGKCLNIEDEAEATRWVRSCTPWYQGEGIKTELPCEPSQEIQASIDDDEQKYKRLDFTNDLVKRWNELYVLLLQPYSLDPRFSDPVILGRSLVVALAHQWDLDRVESGVSISDSDLARECCAALRIKDLCNTIKHVERTQGHYAKIEGISAEVLVDENDDFCFLKNQITYIHEVEGEFDLIEDTRETIFYWARRRGVSLLGIVGWNEVSTNLKACPPSNKITLFYDPQICIYQRSQGLKLYRLGSAGELIPYDHNNIQLEIVDVNRLKAAGGQLPPERNFFGSYE